MTKIFLDISGPFSAERLVGELRRHKQGGKVLDIGTGKAVSLQIMRENGYEAFGVDLRTVFEPPAKPFSVIADVKGLPFLDNAFTAITESFMFAQGYEIDHWREEDYISSFREVRRVLVPGGVFLSSWAGIAVDIPPIGRNTVNKYASMVGLIPERSNDRNILVYQNKT